MHLKAASVSKEVEFLTLPKIKEMFKVLKMLAPVAFLLYACHSDRPPQQEGMIDKYAFGKVNQILVVADSSLWIGPVGDTFYYYFAGPYILTPQPESIFDITHFTPSQFFARSSRKEFRTIIMLADMSDPEAPTARMIRADIGDQKIEEIRKKGGCGVIVGKDKWARNQHIFYLFAFGEKALADCVATQFPAVAGRINKEDESIIEATAYQAGVNGKLQEEILDKFGIELRVPGDFKKAKYDGNLQAMWIRRDVRESHAGIIIHRLPYRSQQQLGKEGIKKIINTIGTLVSSWVVGSRMSVDDVNLPMFLETKTQDGHFTAVARGIWQMENDFKGGPFVCYVIHDEKNGDLVVVYGYVFAPAEEKRDLIQEVEYIVKSVKLVGKPSP